MAEVRDLAGPGLREGRTASRALGYAQVLRFLDGEWSQEQAAAQTVRATRRFARRQESWFRRDPRITWLDGADLAADGRLAGRALAYDQVMRFAKGHGTGNDFLILPDPDDELTLSPELRRAALRPAHRARRGRVLRVVRAACPGGRDPARSGSWTTATPTAASPRCAATGSGCSPATCSATAWPRARSSPWPRGPGCGRSARSRSGEITVDMGAPVVARPERAMVGGRACEGLAVSLGNPHLACVVDVPVAELRPVRPPGGRPARGFPTASTSRCVRVPGDGRLDMRVHERGIGRHAVLRDRGVGRWRRPLAAGTAAAGAGRLGGAGSRAADLAVTLTGTTSLLTGPAVIVAEGELDEAWLPGQTDESIRNARSDPNSGRASAPASLAGADRWSVDCLA